MDVMRDLPGVEINQSGGRGTVTSAFIRGGDSNYNLVMIDGIQLNDFGGGFDLSPLPAEGVEQVEVIRGPQSALYGSNAVAGVINIETIQGDGPPHFSFVGEGGSLYTWRLGTTGAGLNHGFSWAYSLSRLQTDGRCRTTLTANQTSTVSLGYSRISRRKFNANFFGDAGLVGLPGPWGSDPDGLFPGLDPFHAPEPESFRLPGAGNRTVFVSFPAGDHSERFDGPHSVPFPVGRQFVHEQSARGGQHEKRDHRFFQRHAGSGIRVRSRSFKNSFVEGSSDVPFVLGRNSYAFFAENRWTPTDRWFINTGVRVDDLHTDSIPLNNDTGQPGIPADTLAKVTPRISAAYLVRESDDDGFFGATRLHASFGTGFRAPDGFELAFTNNPALKPEESVSYDAGVEQRMAQGRAILDVTYFYNYFKDQIVSTGDLPTNFDSENIGRSRAWGLETTVRIHPFRSFEFSGSYTWMNTAILALGGFTEPSDPFTVGEPLLRRPRNAGGFNATWTRNRLMLNMNATIRGAVLDVEPNYGTFACELGLTCLFRNPGL